MTAPAPLAPATSLDVSALPSLRLGRRSLLWWGNVGMITIESTMFALLIAAYFYLRSDVVHWPPPTVSVPGLGLPLLNLALIVVSALPMHISDKRAEEHDRAGVILWLGIGILFGLGIIVVRGVILRTLDVKWNQNAYGSIVWTILALHASHLFASTVESIGLWLYFVLGRVEEKHFLYARVDTLYWYFVVAAWLPLFAVLYLSPRLM